MQEQLMESEEVAIKLMSNLMATGYCLGLGPLGAVKIIEETNARLDLKVDSRCSVYSRSLMKWCDGHIVDQIVDEETDEEWLVVQYGKKKKRMQRFSPSLRTFLEELNSSQWDEWLATTITKGLKETKITLLRLSLPNEIDTRFEAPTLSIGGITDKSVTFKVSFEGFTFLISDSDSNRIYIQYRIQYTFNDSISNGRRTENGLIRSDLLTTDHWEYTLCSLQSNTEYTFRASYRFAGTSVWSQLSNPQLVKTCDSTRYNAVLVFAYWVRTIFDSMSVSHEMLVDIMWRYYYTPQFKWNFDLIDANCNDILLSDDEKRITAKQLPATQRLSNAWVWRSVHSKDVLSFDMGAKWRWEVTLKHSSSFSLHNLGIGYFDSKRIDKFHAEVADQLLGRGKDEVAFYVGGGEHPAVFANRCHRFLHEKWSLSTRPGDRYALTVDFATRQCSAFYNDEFCGIISNELPDSVYLAACIRRDTLADIALETTCFDLMNEGNDILYIT